MTAGVLGWKLTLVSLEEYGISGAKSWRGRGIAIRLSATSSSRAVIDVPSDFMTAGNPPWSVNASGVVWPGEISHGELLVLSIDNFPAAVPSAQIAAGKAFRVDVIRPGMNWLAANFGCEALADAKIELQLDTLTRRKAEVDAAMASVKALDGEVLQLGKEFGLVQEQMSQVEHLVKLDGQASVLHEALQQLMAPLADATSGAAALNQTLTPINTSVANLSRSVTAAEQSLAQLTAKLPAH